MPGEKFTRTRTAARPDTSIQPARRVSKDGVDLAGV
jgi:hypothetical protein